jgi:hypothetical protein
MAACGGWEASAHGEFGDVGGGSTTWWLMPRRTPELKVVGVGWGGGVGVHC